MKNKGIILKWLFAIIMIVAIYHLSTIQGYAVGNYEKLPQAWKEFFDEYRMAIGGISGFGALTSVAVFIFHMLQLGATSTEPMKRREAIKSILISLVCTSLLGGISVLMLLFYTVIFA